MSVISSLSYRTDDARSEPVIHGIAVNTEIFDIPSLSTIEHILIVIFHDLSTSEREPVHKRRDIPSKRDIDFDFIFIDGHRQAWVVSNVRIFDDRIFILAVNDGDGHRSDRLFVDELRGTIQSSAFKSSDKMKNMVTIDDSTGTLNMDETHHIDYCLHRNHLC